MLAGFGFWHRSPSMVALTLPAFALFHGLVVGYEEPTLRRRFGAPYAEYLRRVNRWIPKPPGGASDGARRGPSRPGRQSRGRPRR